MTEQEMMDWIDNQDYESLLRKWRHAPSGDPLFVGGEVTKHYVKRMNKLREATGDNGVAASKNVGWGHVGPGP